MTATSDRVARTMVLLSVLLTTNAEASIAAVSHSQVVRLEYRARGTLYLCRTLQRKVERVLLELGARTRVTSFYCGELSHVVKAQFVLTIPIEATAANLQRLTSFDSKTVLVARLRGQHLPAAADLPLFPAAWKTVTFSHKQFDRSDCELLQHLRQQVLPKLSVRIINDNLQQCSAPFLVVQALVAEDADRLVDSH